MALEETLREDMKTAMKARDSARVSTVRLLLSDLKNAQIDKRRDLNGEEEIEFLARQAKRRRESIEAYEQGNRQDLVEKERAELVVIEGYLPKQLSAEEATAILREIIAQSGASSAKDLGKVMKEAITRLKGRFPGKDIKGLAETLLS